MLPAAATAELSLSFITYCNHIARRHFSFGMFASSAPVGILFVEKGIREEGAAFALCSFALNQRHMFHDFVIAPMNNGRRPSAKDRNTCVSNLSVSQSTVANVCKYLNRFIVAAAAGRPTTVAIFHDVAGKHSPNLPYSQNDESSPEIHINDFIHLHTKFRFVGDTDSTRTSEANVRLCRIALACRRHRTQNEKNIY